MEAILMSKRLLNKIKLVGYVISGRSTANIPDSNTYHDLVQLQSERKLIIDAWNSQPSTKAITAPAAALALLATRPAGVGRAC